MGRGDVPSININFDISETVDLINHSIKSLRNRVEQHDINIVNVYDDISCKLQEMRMNIDAMLGGSQKKGPQKKWSDEVIVAAVNKHRTIQDAASSIGMSFQGINIRISKLRKEGRLPKYSSNHQRGPQKLWSDSQILSAYRECGFVKSKAARHIGTTYAHYLNRLNKILEDWEHLRLNCQRKSCSDCNIFDCCDAAVKVKGN